LLKKGNAIMTILNEGFRLLSAQLARLIEDGDYRKALQMAVEVVIPEEGDNLAKRDQAVFLQLRANAHRELAEYAEAEKYYLLALPLLAGSVGKEHLSYVRALDDFGQLHAATGRFEQADKLFGQALQYCEHQSDGDRDAPVAYACVLQHHADLLARRTSRRQAMQVIEKSQAIRTQWLGKEHPDFARGLLVESGIGCRLGKTWACEKNLVQAHRILLRALGQSHPWTAVAAHALGAFHLYLLRIKEAEPLLRDALEIRRKVQGDTHPDYAATLSAMADLRLNQGRTKEAEPLARKALSLTRAALGERHPAVADDLTALSRILCSCWRLEEAEEVLQQAKAIVSACYGENHPVVAEALLDLAEVKLRMGQAGDAEKTLLDALERVEQSHADADFEEVLIRAALADHLLRQGQPRQAEPLARQAVATGQALADDDPFLRVPGLVQLAQVRLALGDLAGAQELLQEAKAQVRSVPAHHALALDVAYRRAHLAQLQGDFHAAEDCARTCVSHTCHGLGEQHPSHTQALAYLAAIVHQRGNFEESERLFNQALDLMKQQGGAENPDRAGVLRQLAQIYLARNNLSAAEVRFRETLDIRKAGFGDQHPHVAESYDDMGWLHLQGGNPFAAEGFFRQAQEIRQVTPGKDSPEYALSLHNLARVFQTVNQLPKAEELLEQALQVLGADQAGEHSDCLTVRHTLAMVVWGRRDLDRAEALLQRVVTRCEELGAAANLAVVPALTDLARLYEALGDRLAALECLERIQPLNIAAHGVESLVHALDLVNLSNMLSMLGEPEQAETLAAQAYTIARGLVGDRDTLLIPYKVHLALMYAGTNRNQEAEGLIRQVLEEVGSAGGRWHPDMGRGLTQLADLYAATGRQAEAGPLYEQAVEVLRKAVGEDHPDHAAAWRNLAQFCQSVKDLDRAERAWRKYLALSRRTCGAHHPAVIEALIRLADLERGRTNLATAGQLYREGLELVNQSEVPLDAARAGLLHSLSLVRRAQNQPLQAEEMLRAAIDLDRTAIGEETPGHLEALNQLAGLCAATQREAEALDLWGRLLNSRQRLFWAYCCMKPGPAHEDFITQSRVAVDCLLTIATRHPGRGAPALEAVLHWKGLTLAKLPWLDKQKLLQHHPQLKKQLQRRFYLGRQTAARGWFGVGQEGIETHRRLLGLWQKEREQIEEELADKVPAFAHLCRLRANLVQTIAGRLPAGSILIEFVRYLPRRFKLYDILDGEDHRYLALLLPAHAPDQVALVDLGLARPIDQLVRALNSFWPFGHKAKRASLARAILAPLAGHFKDRRELVIAPDGDLGQVDFGQLPDDNARSLAHRFTLRQVSTGRELIEHIS
jgi:tetratricopeptide (TPR) repeat protein